MNKDKIAKMKGKNLKIRPIALRIDPTRGELPPIDDAWHVRDVSREMIALYNPRTHDQIELGTDHIKEFLSDPGRTDGILILKSQFVLRLGGLSVEPIV